MAKSIVIFLSLLYRAFADPPSKSEKYVKISMTPTVLCTCNNNKKATEENSSRKGERCYT